jgi:hypothetical protein
MALTLTIAAAGLLAAYYIGLRYIGPLGEAPPGAAAKVLKMQQWGAVPVSIVEIARSNPKSLQMRDYETAVLSTYLECSKFANDIHQRYDQLNSEVCSLAASEHFQID